MYGKSSSSSHGAKTDGLWLSSTSGADNSGRLYVGFQGREFKTFLVVCLLVAISMKS